MTDYAGYYERTLFAIDGIPLYGPDGYQEMPTPVVGYNLAGEPILQGYPEITFTWSFMRQEHFTELAARWDPENPRVQVTYIDKETGDVVTRWGMMHEPAVGARNIVYYNNVAVKVTHLEEEEFVEQPNLAEPLTSWEVDFASAGLVVSLEEDFTKWESWPSSGRLRIVSNARTEPDGDGWVDVHQKKRTRIKRAKAKAQADRIAVEADLMRDTTELRPLLMLHWWETKNDPTQNVREVKPGSQLGGLPVDTWKHKDYKRKTHRRDWNDWVSFGLRIMVPPGVTGSVWFDNWSLKHLDKQRSRNRVDFVEEHDDGNGKGNGNGSGNGGH